MSIFYNAFDDFSILQNPNGVWTYQTGGVAYTFSGTETGYEYWAVDGTPGAAGVLVNTTGSPVDIGTISLPPGLLGLDPGLDTDSTVRFTAPERAYYVVTGGFVGIDTAQAPHIVEIIAASRSFFQGIVGTYDESRPFSLVLLLNAGDAIDFVNYGNGIGNAATSLQANVIQAANFVWKKARDGDFETAINWTPAGVPSFNDTVAIKVGGTYTVTSSSDQWLACLAIKNANATLAITGGTFTALSLVNTGSILVGNGTADATLALQGDVANSGTVTLFGDGAVAALSIGAAGVVLSGGGSIVLGGPDGGVVTSVGNGVLSNVSNLISGTGELGDGEIQLVNGKWGVIEAQGGELRVSTASPIVNSGTFRAAAGSTLTIASDVYSRGSTSTFESNGAGAKVVFENVTVLGRTTLQGVSGGSFAIGAGLTTMDRNLTINGDLAIDAAGNGADSALMLEGATVNTGMLTVTGGASEVAQLQICDATVALTGGGSIVLAGDPANSGIVGTTFNSRLINYDNTVEGAGYVGQGFFGGPLQLTNEVGGTFDANVSGQSLVIDVPDIVFNRGTMQATDGGTLVIRGAMVADTGSLFAASGGGNIVLEAVDMFGDITMEADSGSAIVVGAGFTSLEGEVSFSGDVTVDAVANGGYTELMLLGPVTNTGTITVTSSLDALGMLSVCDGAVILQGGGSVVLSGQTASMPGTSFNSKLTNVDNTIEGEGLIGFMPIVNLAGGTIDANVDGGMMLLAPDFGSSNSGTLQASNGGMLDIQGVISFSKTGVLKTIGATSSVLLDGATLGNATLDASAGGAIAVMGLGSSLLGKTALSGELTLDAATNEFDTSLELAGTLTNQGVVRLVGYADAIDPDLSYAAELFIGTTTYLKGGGHIVLSGDPGKAIISGATASTLLYNIDNTIEGTGLLGDQFLTLINHAGGVIEADVSGQTLLVDTGANAIINQGTFRAIDGGILTVASAVDKRGFGFIDGGTLEFQSSVDIAVSFSADGGTLEIDDSDVFKGSVAGLADNDESTIALTDIDFASVVGAFKQNGSNTAGVLTVTDGTDSARLTLLGQYANAFSTAPPPGFVGFVLSDDGTANHGTLVTYHGP